MKTPQIKIMNLEEIELRLREVPFNFRVRKVEDLQRCLARYKEDSVAGNDQVGAKRIWCLETILKIQENYLKAFSQLKEGKFYAAWCNFERVENGCSALRRHVSNPADYWIDFILEKTHKWQELFPYRMFFSPAYIIKEKRCNICDEKVRLRGGCSHLMGEIYNGRMCAHQLIHAPFQEISLTPFPHQKYSVAFLDGGSPDNDNYDYRIARHTIGSLDSPSRDWYTQHTHRNVPIEKLGAITADETCPCGSKETYVRCCSGQTTIKLPWIHIVVDSPEVQQTSAFLSATFLKPTSFDVHKRLVSTLIFDVQS